MALRPKTLTAALAPIVVATALVASQGHKVRIWISAFALLSSIFIQIGTNLINDALDFKKGADDANRIGPQRVTQSGLLTARQVMIGGGLCFVIAAVLGLPLVIEGGLPILYVGLISLLCGYIYTGGPYPLAYRGLGDIFVIIFFGFVAVAGTFLLHVGHITYAVWIAGFQVGSLATVLIAINNMRDAPLDVKAGKHTLAVRFGLTFARFEIAFLAFSPFLIGMYWVFEGAMPAAILPILIFPMANRLVRSVFNTAPSPEFNKFLAQAAGLHLAFSILLAIGLLLR